MLLDVTRKQDKISCMLHSQLSFRPPPTPTQPFSKRRPKALMKRPAAQTPEEISLRVTQEQKCSQARAGSDLGEPGVGEPGEECSEARTGSGVGEPGHCPGKGSEPTAVVLPPAASGLGLRSEDVVMCGKCREEVAVDGVSSAGGGVTFKCSKCNVAIVKMNRQGFTVGELDGLSPEKVAAFYKGAHDRSPKDLLAYRMEKLSEFKRDTSVEEVWGEWQPMKFWVDKGYKEEAVEKNGQMVNDARWGPLYRVPVRGCGTRTESGTQQESSRIAETRPRRVTPKAKPKAKAKKTLPTDLSAWTEEDANTWAAGVTVKITASKKALDDELSEWDPANLPPSTLKAAQDASALASTFLTQLADVQNGHTKISEPLKDLEGAVKDATGGALKTINKCGKVIAKKG